VRRHPLSLRGVDENCKGIAAVEDCPRFHDKPLIKPGMKSQQRTVFVPRMPKASGSRFRTRAVSWKASSSAKTRPSHDGILEIEPPEGHVRDQKIPPKARRPSRTMAPSIKPCSSNGRTAVRIASSPPDRRPAARRKLLEAPASVFGPHHVPRTSLCSKNGIRWAA